MKNKKAFTLIELLAVIVILAIIALIVTVTIGNIIDNAKKETYKNTVRNLIRSGENFVAQYVIDNHKDLTYPMIFTCDGTDCKNENYKLQVSGVVPRSGKVIVESQKNIRVEYLYNGSYCASGIKESIQVAKTCTDIDITMPTITGTLNGKVWVLTLTDLESGIDSYCVTTTNDSAGCEWTIATSSVNHTLPAAGTYYAFAKDRKNNVSTSIIVTAPTTAFCAYEIGQVWDTEFATGQINEWTAPCTANYKLEVWGAGSSGTQQSGGVHGKGGYSSGFVNLDADDVLNVVVGGTGGYNGGGGCAVYDSIDRTTESTYGGGATHIARKGDSYTTLSSYSNATTAAEYVYIVAGGGGSRTYYSSTGGNGGGINGTNGLTSSNTTAGAAGTQSTGYAFGQGQSGSGGTRSATNGTHPFCGASGGGGWYGGYAYNSIQGGAGGGSGYIGGVTDGTSIAGNAAMPTYDGESTMTGNSGNGYAKITLISY